MSRRDERVDARVEGRVLTGFSDILWMLLVAVLVAHIVWPLVSHLRGELERYRIAAELVVLSAEVRQLDTEHDRLVVESRARPASFHLADVARDVLGMRPARQGQIRMIDLATQGADDGP